MNALVSSHGYVWVSQDKRPPVVQMWEAGTREAVSITVYGGAMEQFHNSNKILAIFVNFMENFQRPGFSELLLSNVYFVLNYFLETA